MQNNIHNSFLLLINSENILCLYTFAILKENIHNKSSKEKCMNV